MSVFTHALSTNNYGCAKFIVSSSAANGTHTTIASAVGVASSGDTVFIRPGTYTEDFTLPAGVNLAAYDCDAFNNVIINGKITVTAATTVAISGIQLRTNSDFCLVVSGSSATIVHLKNCNINALNNTAISHTSSSSSSAIRINQCRGDLGTTGIGLYASTSAGQIVFTSSNIGNSGSSLTASDVSAGTIRFNNTTFNAAVSTSSTGVVVCQNSNMGVPAGLNAVALTTAGTGQSLCYNTYFNAGTSSAISIGAGSSVELGNCVIVSTNANSITGAGSLGYSELAMQEATGSDINPTTVSGKVVRVGSIRSSTMPAFLAYLATADANATGDGTAVTLGSITALTEVFDQGSNFVTTGTFTAPYTGRYEFNNNVALAAIGAAHTACTFTIVTSNRSKNVNSSSPIAEVSAAGNLQISGSGFFDMDVSDTATLSITVSNSTKTVTINGAASLATSFAGWMVC